MMYEPVILQNMKDFVYTLEQTVHDLKKQIMEMEFKPVETNDDDIIPLADYYNWNENE